MDKKTFGGAAALMLTSALAGAGAMKAASPLNATAVVDGINVGSDGATGLHIHGVVAGGAYSRTLNWDAQGGSPLIEGQPWSNSTAIAIGPALSTCIATVRAQVSSMASDLATWTPTVVPSPLDAGQ